MRKLGWLMVLVCATACGAQVSGGLRGVVTDRAGADLPNAHVTVKMGKHVMSDSTTDAGGAFWFSGSAGTYDVSISLQGYQSSTGMVTFQDGKPTPIVLKKVGEAGSGLEYGVLVQGGNGLTENEGGFHFLMAGVHAGKVLTDNIGPGVLKGNFEYAVEVFPFWQSYTPKFQRQMCVPSSTPGYDYCSAPYTVGGTFTGASITPVILRWNLAAGTKWKPWLQGGGGVIWTNHKYPAVGGPPILGAGLPGLYPVSTVGNNLPSNNSSVWNFTPQFGVGAHYFIKPNRSIDFGANAVHISSASLGDKNPGVNASVQVNVGYSWWK